MQVFFPGAVRYRGVDYPYGWADLPQAIADVLLAGNFCQTTEKLIQVESASESGSVIRATSSTIYTNADVLNPPTFVHPMLTAAISTTAVLSAASPGTTKAARIAWLNNGASATAKLYIAVNADNDTAGLAATQSAKQRDVTLTMGDSIIITSPVPISILHFSSDTSITASTHNLSVIFGN